LLNSLVYLFVGSIIVRDTWKTVPGALVGFVGIGYIVLEYIPSIEPPANMRYQDTP
jgi:drug/metabolite transporter (DMT)-like permease